MVGKLLFLCQKELFFYKPSNAFRPFFQSHIKAISYKYLKIVTTFPVDRMVFVCIPVDLCFDDSYKTTQELLRIVNTR